MSLGIVLLKCESVFFPLKYSEINEEIVYLQDECLFESFHTHILSVASEMWCDVIHT